MDTHDAQATRQRLLDAAGEVFADLGFHKATVRDICQRAGANIAAINYHFGGKEELYRELLVGHFKHELERFPLPALTDGFPPEVVIEQFVFTMLSRMLDEGKPAWQAKLMVREMADPSPEMDTVVQQHMKPNFEFAKSVIRRLLGPGVPEHRATLLTLSLVGQVVFYKMSSEAVRRVTPEIRTGPEERAGIARHIAQVVCAAAEAIRKEFSGAVASAVPSAVSSGGPADGSTCAPGVTQ